LPFPNPNFTEKAKNVENPQIFCILHDFSGFFVVFFIFAVSLIRFPVLEADVLSAVFG
jgi:hypothetical protein